jgi:hypothetical protein
LEGGNSKGSLSPVLRPTKLGSGLLQSVGWLIALAKYEGTRSELHTLQAVVDSEGGKHGRVAKEHWEREGHTEFEEIGKSVKEGGGGYMGGVGRSCKGGILTRG